MDHLHGKRVLVSRSREQAATLSEQLRAHGASVIEIPFIEIREPQSYEALDTMLKRIMDYEWLILTSVNGVRALFARLEKLGFDSSALLHLNIAAIGPATAKAIEKHGLPVDVVPEEYVAESVVAALAPQIKGQRVLLVRAKVARDVIPNELRAAGAKVHVVEAYETVVPESSRARLREVIGDPKLRPHAITFTSSSTVRNFVELAGGPDAAMSIIDGIKLASIGPVTSATLRDAGLRVDMEAKEYTIPGLVQALSKSL